MTDMSIYLDNAATTSLHPEVFDAMKPWLTDNYGNPSSIHSYGRQARVAIEAARNNIAGLIQCASSEIFFTSGGTEANNAVITSATESFDIQHIITSPVEHHSVLHTIAHLEKTRGTNVSFVDIDQKGRINTDHLHDLLKDTPKTLVSLMEANNEIGTLTPLIMISEICKEHNAWFHSDTVQAVAHYAHNLNHLQIDGMSASGHKFHGPKGAGFMFISKRSRIRPFIYGGPQEHEMRAGTENVAGIVGFAKALDIAYDNMADDATYIQKLKNQMINSLSSAIKDVAFNGDLSNSLYTILNVSLPASESNQLVLFNLDLAGIAASGGSACSAGAVQESHVIKAIGADPNREVVRFSFSALNTEQDIKLATDKLASLYQELKTNRSGVPKDVRVNTKTEKPG